MNNKEKYNITIETYRALGRKYLETLANGIIPELDEFVSILAPKSKVLDVGCAGGRDASIFCEKGFDVVGIDVVDIFINEAIKSVPGAAFKIMDARELNFTDGYFDAVWARSFLLHFDNKTASKILKSFYRILKPGGKLLLTVKKGSGSRFEIDSISGSHKRFFKFFSKPEIETIVKKSGFWIIKSQSSPDELKRKDVAWIKILAKK
jgi:ubiquinone/menaquinone biosynthesis C-methylase UbiE